MRFCDHAKIYLSSGAGGRGAVSFRREKNIPFGGPDGGHGGDGGNVIFRGNKHHVTLYDFRCQPHHNAQSGQQGHGKKKAGAAGKDLYIDVPLGTEVWIDGQMVFELLRHDEQKLILRGGKGGRGNTSFASATNRTPREYTPGESGQSTTAQLKLKILADVGLIGMPNAGKSTLLAALTASQTKVGNYPFTTLYPHLGTLVTPDHQELLLADLPGLVEGASTGKGLGHQFLSHGQRCKGLVHVIDGSSECVRHSYDAIWGELKAYSPEFATKKELVVITKKDLITDDDVAAIRGSFDHDVTIMSAHCPNDIAALETLLWTSFQS